MGWRLSIVALMGLALLVGLSGLGGTAQEARRVVINEVAWSGTLASAADEWIELHNNSDRDVDLAGWTLSWEGVTIHFGADEGNTKEVRRSVIPARGFYLLERTDDETISDLEADLIYTGSLDNDGESLFLKNAQGEVIDTANLEGGDWPAGTTRRGDPPAASMERINPRGPDAPTNWASNNGTRRNGKDAKGQPINGTPKSRNSAS